MVKPLHIGLTGGIANGKSTVARLFACHGAPVVDTDQIARRVVEPGTRGLHEVREEFGETMIGADGSLDRSRLAKLIFSDDAARVRLENLLHPLIKEQLSQRLERINAPYVVVVVPLLIETGMDKEMDQVVVIDISEQEQARRLVKRDGISSTAARQRINSQTDREHRRAKADKIIHNKGSLQDLEKTVMRLHYQFTTTVNL